MSNDLVEVTESLPLADASLAGTIAQVEIDTLIQTARRFPRSISRAVKAMTDLATLDEQAADECVYSLPRGGKTIEGPSIRFAELCAQSWGNCRVAARTTVIDRGDKFVEAEGFFLDAETNVATLARIRRRIVDSKGRLYNDDMILVTCNAAQSIARRNAILAGIPKQVWRRPYEASRQVIMGDIKTLGNRRAEAIKAFQRFGLGEAQVLALMGVKGVEDIDQERLVPLRGMYSSLHNQEVTVEDLLRGIEPDKPHRVTAATATMSAPAQFASDGLPSADAAPTAGPRPTPAAPAAAQPEAVAVSPAGQPSLAFAEADDEGILDDVRRAFAAADTAAKVKKVWTNVEKLLEGEDRTAGEKIRDAALARVSASKQAVG